MMADQRSRLCLGGQVADEELQESKWIRRVRASKASYFYTDWSHITALAKTRTRLFDDKRHCCGLAASRLMGVPPLLQGPANATAGLTGHGIQVKDDGTLHDFNRTLLL
jgi:hypothetical protein